MDLLGRSGYVEVVVRFYSDYIEGRIFFLGLSLLSCSDVLKDLPRFSV